MAFSDDLALPTPSRYTQSNIDELQKLIARKSKVATLSTRRANKTDALVLPRGIAARDGVFAQIAQ